VDRFSLIILRAEDVAAIDYADDHVLKKENVGHFPDWEYRKTLLHAE